VGIEVAEMSDFAERIKKRNDQFFQRVNKSKRAVTFAMLSQVVLGTPVQTGRARGNWQVSTGTPVEGEKDIMDKSGGTALSSGNTVIQRSKLEDDIWIANNLPYIYKLAYQYSPKTVPAQNSPGWFRAIITNFKSLINKAWGQNG
jgi:hypothetical protein